MADFFLFINREATILLAARLTAGFLFLFLIAGLAEHWPVAKLNLGSRPIWRTMLGDAWHTMDFEDDTDPHNPNKFRGSRTG
jgi:hypothetical protein